MKIGKNVLTPGETVAIVVLLGIAVMIATGIFLLVWRPQ